MRKFWNKHKAMICKVVAALIVPGGLVILAADLLRKYFRKK
jgi:hypothetical protein